MVQRVLHHLTLDKIAAVDRPAQEPATVALIKREQAQDFVWHPDHGLIPRGANTITTAAGVEKRRLSEAERGNLAGTGAAPDFAKRRAAALKAISSLAKSRAALTGETYERAFSSIVMAEPELQRALQ